MTKGENDVRMMRQALRLAALGRGCVSPNPMVGALVVRAGRVVASGWHRRFGGPHAEVEALRALPAGQTAGGATLYVTLEPCSTTGKTPPCTRAILESGVRRVVAAVQDPNPRHAGRGLRLLREAGLEVRSGVMEEEARDLNAPFFKHQMTGLPHVRLKMALTLDGRTATRTGDSKWISSPQSRTMVRQLRAVSDCVMVGIGTVRADDPVLLPGDWAEGRQPYRAIVDPGLAISPRAKLFTQGEASRVLLICRRTAGARARRGLEALGARVLPLLEGRQGRADLGPALRHLAGELGIIDILCEGGSELAASLISGRYVDRMVLFLAPKLFGGRAAPGVLGGDGVDLASHAVPMTDLSARWIGPDLCVEGKPLYPAV